MLCEHCTAIFLFIYFCGTGMWSTTFQCRIRPPTTAVRTWVAQQASLRKNAQDAPAVLMVKITTPNMHHLVTNSTMKIFPGTLTRVKCNKPKTFSPIYCYHTSVQHNWSHSTNSSSFVGGWLRPRSYTCTIWEKVCRHVTKHTPICDCW